jgi:septum formation protein
MNRLADIDLVLASTSRYRGALLARLKPRFLQEPPQVDETARADETPVALAARLAQAKARNVASIHEEAIILGSDQVADCDGCILGKPESFERAFEQLRASAGNIVLFHTALCVIDRRTNTAREFAAVDTTRVVFRPLSDAQITRYLEAEKPYDCAGSFKCEGLGISLFERIESSDPTALIGLPLIALCRLLGEAGIEVI